MREKKEKSKTERKREHRSKFGGKWEKGHNTEEGNEGRKQNWREPGGREKESKFAEGNRRKESNKTGGKREEGSTVKERNGRERI